MRCELWPQKLIAAAALASIICLPIAAPADDYPNKPIKLVVPAGAGSAADLRARQIAERLSRSIGQPVIVDNRPGAGGTIGAAFAAKAKPDGYTILYGTISDQAIAPNLYLDLSYNPSVDFIPLVQNSLIPPILVVNPALGINNIKELIAAARARPDQLTYASGGPGTLAHLLGLQLAREAGIKIVHVPYKSAAAALNDVVAGHVSMNFDYMPATRPFLESGKLKALMTVGHKRSKILPDVPSAAELGMPSIEHMGWSVMLVPAGTPTEIVRRLNTEFVRAVRSPEILQVIIDSGGDPDGVGKTPEEVAAFVKRELESIAKLIKLTGMTVE